MASNALVQIMIKAVDQASNVINQVQDSMNQMESSMQRAEKASYAMLAMVTAAAAGLGAFIKIGFGANTTLEQQRQKWTTLTGSIEEADGVLDQFTVMQQKSPFSNASIDAYVTSMYGLGYSVNDAMFQYEGLGNVASAYGLTEEQLRRAVLATTQIFSKGKLVRQEMNQMAEAGIPIVAELADMMGVSADKVYEMSENGEITNDTMEKLFTHMNTKYAGSMEGFSNTLSGAWGRAKEAFESFAGSLTAPLYEKVSAWLIPLIDKFEAFSGKIFALRTDAAGMAQAIIGMFPPQVLATIMAITGAIMVGLIPALYAIAGGILAATAPIIPFLAIGAALGLLAYHIMSNWQTFAPFFSGIFNTVKTYAEGFKNAFMAAFESLKGSMSGTWEAIKMAFMSIVPILQLIGTAFVVALTLILSVFNGIVAAIGPFIAAFANLLAFFGHLISAIVKLFTGDLKGAWESLNKAGHAIIDAMKAAWEGLKAFFVNFANTVGQIFLAFGVDIKQKMTDAFNKAKDAVVKFTSEAGAKIKEFSSKAAQWFSEMGQKIKSTVTEMWNNVKAAFADGIASGLAYLAGAVGDFMQAGRDLVLGLAKGIANAMGDAVAAIGKVASSVIEKGKAMFKTKSPSRVFMGIGNDVVDGQTIGMLDRMKSAQNAIAKVGKGVINVATGIASQAFQEYENVRYAMDGDMQLKAPKTEQTVRHEMEFGKLEIDLSGDYSGFSDKDKQNLIKEVAAKVGENFDNSKLRQQVRRVGRKT